MNLSKHTASLEAEKKRLLKVVPVKPRTSSEDIEKSIDTAILRSSLVAIQIEAVDDDGNNYCFAMQTLGLIKPFNISITYKQ